MHYLKTNWTWKSFSSPRGRKSRLRPNNLPITKPAKSGPTAEVEIARAVQVNVRDLPVEATVRVLVAKADKAASLAVIVAVLAVKAAPARAVKVAVADLVLPIVISADLVAMIGASHPVPKRLCLCRKLTSPSSLMKPASNRSPARSR